MMAGEREIQRAGWSEGKSAGKRGSIRVEGRTSEMVKNTIADGWDSGLAGERVVIWKAGERRR